MNVIVNGDPRDLPDGISVADLVARLRPGGPDGVAVARNGEVVPRSSWRATDLDPGDRVEVLSATQGG